MIVVDERSHAVAIREAITAHLGPWEAFDIDDLPKNLPTIYVETHLSRRTGAPLRATSTTERTGWRLLTRVVAKTVDEARWARMRVSEAIEQQRLAITDVGSTTRIQVEAEEPIALDDKRYSGATTWTYAL